MLSSSLDALLKLSKTSSPQKLFDYDCVTLYLVKSDLSSVHVYYSIHWTSYFLEGTKKTRPCITGHPVDYEYADGQKH